VDCLKQLLPKYRKGWELIEFSLKSSCLHPVFGPLFTPYPLFEWGMQSKEVLLNLGMKTDTQHLMHKVRGSYSSCTCRSSENIFTSGGGPQKKGNRGSKEDETQFGTKSGGPPAPPPPSPRLLFCRCFLKSHSVLDQTQGSGAVFSWLYSKTRLLFTSIVNVLNTMEQDP
jgi:hypothetical protein